MVVALSSPSNTVDIGVDAVLTTPPPSVVLPLFLPPMRKPTVHRLYRKAVSRWMLPKGGSSYRPFIDYGRLVEQEGEDAGALRTATRLRRNVTVTIGDGSNGAEEERSAACC